MLNALTSSISMHLLAVSTSYRMFRMKKELGQVTYINTGMPFFVGSIDLE